jgi:uncharacterized membrane protein
LVILGILQLMDEKNDIDELKKELEQLKKQLFQYHDRVVELQQRIAGLENRGTIGVEPSKTKAVQVFSLENFIGLRLIHFVGIVILVIGLSIGVKYAIDKNLISEGMRIAFAYAAGIVLYGLSVWLRKNYKSFSAILFSGGMASLYFTTYAAFVYYQIFSFPVAFILMILLTFYTVYEAIRYNRQEIALLGLVGAYAIPFLISQNNDRADLFFFYISIINLAVVFLSINKNWKFVGRVAQVISWVLFIGWAAMRFNVNVQWIGFLVMLFFFCLFLFNNLSQRFINKRRLTITDSYFVILNNVALYVAALFIFAYSFGDADISIITFIISVCIGLQAIGINFLWPEEHLIKRGLVALSLFLFVLFIAFNWNGLTVTLLWLLTAVLVFSLGIYRKSVLLRMTAMLLMGLTLLKLLMLDSLSFSPVQKIISYVLLGVLLLVVSFYYQKFKKQLFGE